MNKEIRGLVTEIIIFTIIIAVMIPLWINVSQKNKNDTYALLSMSSELKIQETTTNVQTYLIPYEDNYASENIKARNFMVTNMGSNDKDYYFIMKIDKKSTLDYKDVVSEVNDEIIHLKDANMQEDDDNYYLYLLSDTIEETDNVEFKMWLEQDTSYNMENTMSFSFFVNEVDKELVFNN